VDAYEHAWLNGEPFTTVAATLDPCSSGTVGFPDTSRFEPDLASGLAILARCRDVPPDQRPPRLIACVSDAQHWGAMSLYACAAHAWLGADVLDIAGIGSSNGQATLIPSCSRAGTIISPTVEAAARHLHARAHIIWDTLFHIEQARYRGGLSHPIGHAPQWLRAIVRCEYRPQALALLAEANRTDAAAARMATAPDHADHAAIPRSRKTIIKHLAETFDMMTDIAIEYFGDEGMWPEMGVNPPQAFWESPLTRRIRSFIDASFNFFVFDDIDPLWQRYANWLDLHDRP
jgi:hypothetical protein